MVTRINRHGGRTTPDGLKPALLLTCSWKEQGCLLARSASRLYPGRVGPWYLRHMRWNPKHHNHSCAGYLLTLVRQNAAFAADNSSRILDRIGSKENRVNLENTMKLPSNQMPFVSTPSYRRHGNESGILALPTILFELSSKQR